MEELRVGRSQTGYPTTAADDPRAHKGIAVPGFPNYFLAVGPNGLVLNVSYFLSAEKNIETIVSLLDEAWRTGLQPVAVRQEVFEQYNNWMAQRFSRFSWGSSDCNSYYRNASGHAQFLFPGNYKEYCKLHDETGLHEFEQG